MVSVITSIGFDHTEILGDTIEKIAAEKAGIVKPGVPLVVGRLGECASGVVHRIAAATGSPIRTRVVLDDVRTTDRGSRVRIQGGQWSGQLLELVAQSEFQLDNVAVAIAALSVLNGEGVTIPAETLQKGLLAARWPGRLERCAAQPRLWWDGAHNAQGVEALARAWVTSGRPAPSEIVLALSRDKDAAAILGELADFAPEAGLIATRAQHERALPPERIVEIAGAAGTNAHVSPDVATALHAALAAAADGTVLLTGSLFAVGEAMAAFGGAPGEML